MAEADRTLASDAEREQAVAQLRDAAGSGRLDADELERRVAAAYAARTRGELAGVTADLPTAVASSGSRARSQAIRRRAAAFVTLNAICVVVWLATGANGGFWPIWVILASGIGLFASIVRAAFGVEEPDEPPGGPPVPPLPPGLR